MATKQYHIWLYEYINRTAISQKQNSDIFLTHQILRGNKYKIKDAQCFPTCSVILTDIHILQVKAEGQILKQQGQVL